MYLEIESHRAGCHLGSITMSAAFRFVLLLAVSDLKSTKNLFKNVQLLVVLLYFYPEIKSFFFAQGQS